MAGTYPYTHSYKDADDGISDTWAHVSADEVTFIIVERGGDEPGEGVINLSHEDARAFAEEILSILEGNDA